MIAVLKVVFAKLLASTEHKSIPEVFQIYFKLNERVLLVDNLGLRHTCVVSQSKYICNRHNSAAISNQNDKLDVFFISFLFFFLN